MYEPPMTSSQRPQTARSHVGSVPAAWSTKMRGARISLCWRLLVGSSWLLKSNRRNRRNRRVILVDLVGSEGVALRARLFGRARACLAQMIGPGACAVERANAVPPLRGNPLARRASFALKTALELAHLRDALGVVWFGRAEVVVEPAIHDTRALVHDRLAVGVYL